MTPEELAEASTDGSIHQEYQKTINRLQQNLAREKNRSDGYYRIVDQVLRDTVKALDLPPVPPPVKDKRRKGEEFAIAVLSDWQLGKITPTYSSEICENRIELYSKKVTRIVEAQREDHPVKTLHVVMLGDMVEGELIFPGQAHEIDSSLFRQVAVDGPRIMGNFIRTMASQFETVKVHCVPGNHGYLGGRSRKEMHKESNADRMLYTFVSGLTADLPNVEWDIADDWWLVANMGDNCRFLLAHGNQVRGYNGIPWYGWTRKVMGWRSLERIWGDFEFDHVLAGHFHTPVNIYINGVRLWVNASTESHNPYALEQLAAAGEPAQWLLFGKDGKGVTSEYLVKLDDKM